MIRMTMYTIPLPSITPRATPAATRFWVNQYMFKPRKAMAMNHSTNIVVSRGVRCTRRSSHTGYRRGVATIATVTIRWLSTRGWRGSLLLPRGSSRRSPVATLGAVSVVASSAALGPWGCASVVSRSVIVATVVPASLLPGSDIAGWWASLPRLHIAVVVALIGAGFNATRHVAIFTRRTSGQFLHKLLDSS